ncbi:MAG: penicillin-binding protein 2, partial [Nitrospiraceae bacterium]|nr:penicillin-binding protein 2 [Nitrospiraceae bacterium]
PKGVTEKTPAAGHSLTLTVDEFIQYVAEKELEDAVTAARAKAGTVIVMEPRTGAVLAMALSPKFDPNTVTGVPPDRWRNRALTDTYEPGSTAKVIVAAAALEEKVMRPETQVYGENGRMEIAGTTIHDHDRSAWMTFAEIIEHSSNIGAVKTAMALGDLRLYRYLKAFGFGERTEIDLPGEVAGLIKEPKSWGRRSLASMAIGQEIGITSLQLVTAISAVANGGRLMRPYVVSEIRDAEGVIVDRTEPLARRRPISAQTARILTGMLEGVITRGTGSKAAVPGYRVAGKTGTAQKINPQTGRYSQTLFVGSFAGYAPADDPRIAIVVVIDEPRTEAWGGVVAAPVFRRIAEQILPYLGVPSQERTRLAFAMADRTNVSLP